jgi:predicted RNase H-like HicB family nuclease
MARGAAEGGCLRGVSHHSARCAAYHDSMNKPYFVRAEWDDEAAVWVATSDDVPGLVTEAQTLEALDAKLKSMVPELLEANGCMPADGQVAVELLARRFSIALPSAA